MPPGQPSAIASGPTLDESSTLLECRQLIARLGITPALPAALRQRLARGEIPPNLGSADPLLAKSQFGIACDNALALQSLRATVEAAAVIVEMDTSCDDQPFEIAADHLLQRLSELKARHPDRRVAVLTGGELSVPLPPDPGTGGRNQHFVLACALRIDGQPIRVLSCGTDGIDGNSPAAGAVADSTTIERAAALGLNAEHQFNGFDAFPLFEALGDAVIIGPTGTNIRDVRVLVHD